MSQIAVCDRFPCADESTNGFPAGIAGCARSGEILVSSTVRDLVAGSGFRFEDRSVRSFPGAEGEWRLLLLVSSG
jgi:hypothetical protein